LLALAAFVLIGWGGPAFATDDEDPCSHPVFVTHECLDTYDGGAVDGEDGVDGLDGIDGVDGADGRDGVDGIDGLNGRDGRDGIVPRSWYEEMNEFISASNAVTAYLPQDGDNRVTVGMGRANGRTGVGVGYARRIQDNNYLTLSVARSGDSVVGNAALTVEF